MSRRAKKKIIQEGRETIQASAITAGGAAATADTPAVAAVFLLCLLSPLIVATALGGDEQFSSARLALLGVIVSFWALWAAARGGFKAVLPPLLYGIPMLLFLLWAAAAGAPRPAPVAAFLAFFLLFSLAFNLRAGEKAAAWIEWGILAAGLAGALYGILVFLRVLNWFPYVNWGNRTAGAFEDPNYFGLCMVFPLLWALAGIVGCAGAGENAGAAGTGAKKAAGAVSGAKNNYSFLRRIIRYAAAAACAAALVLSNSRSAWGAMAASLPVFLAASAYSKGGAGRAERTASAARAAKAAAALILLLATAGLLFSQLPVSKRTGFNPAQRIREMAVLPGGGPSGRVNLHRAALMLVAEKPLTGFGAGSFPVEMQRTQAKLARSGALGPELVRRTRHAYNDYLELAAETGIPGLLLYSAILILVICGAARALRTAPAHLRPFIPGITAYLAAYVAFSAFYQSAMHNVPAAAMFWLCAGLAAGAPGASRAEAAGNAPSPAGRAAATAVLLPAAAAILYFLTWAGPAADYHYNAARGDLAAGNLESAAARAAAAARVRKYDPYPVIIGAEIAVQQQNYEEAERFYGDALRIYPYDSNLHESIGLFYYYRGNMDAAAGAFYKALELEPGSREALYQYYAETLLARGNAREAEETAKAGIAEYPGSAPLTAELARIYLETRRPIDAEATAARAAAMDPACAVCRNRHAETLIVLGQFDAARRETEEALRLDPGNSFSRKLADHLERMETEAPPPPE